MGFVLFLLGFLMCGFIACGIFMYVVWKTLRGEDVSGFTVEFKRKPYRYTYNGPEYRPCYRSYQEYIKPVIDVNQEAINIVEMFDDLLTSKGIKVPSDEDYEREEDNEAALYGIVYGDLVDEVEDAIRDIVKRCER